MALNRRGRGTPGDPALLKQHAAHPSAAYACHHLDGETRSAYQGRVKHPPRIRRPRNAPKKPQSLRIALGGTRSPAELRQMVFEATVRLEELGIRQVKGINLYLTPVDAHGNSVTAHDQGRRIERITIAEPYPCAADGLTPGN